ncbi:MAG TPA: DUF5615 family PIN-like protein [Rhizomicrobium sp.]|jgi:predicted nuclease of predicted toxin-antitoxin system|nr:DUF5615 family PIN-like protein [Rhizomicrobium sp.]
MKIWLDEHLSPQLAPWIAVTFEAETAAIRDLGLAWASDREVFDAARKTGAIMLTKDVDFIGILERLGPPPQIIWLTCGNTSNANLRWLLQRSLRRALEELERGETFVEIG